MISIKILAIDQATKNSGFCLIDSSTKEIKAFGTLQADEKKKTELRIHDLKSWLEKTIIKEAVDLVLIEDIQFQRNYKVYKTLAQLQGVLIEMCVANNIKYKVVASATWKSRVGIQQTKRAEEKKRSIIIASEVVGEDVHEDTADAICMVLSELMGSDKQ